MLEEQACDVPTRPSKARDVSECNWIIVHGHHEDGDCNGCFLGGTRCGIGCRNDKVHAEMDQFPSKLRQPVRIAFCVTILKGDVIALVVA